MSNNLGGYHSQQKWMDFFIGFCGMIVTTLPFFLYSEVVAWAVTLPLTFLVLGIPAGIVFKRYFISIGLAVSFTLILIFAFGSCMMALSHL